MIRAALAWRPAPDDYRLTRDDVRPLAKRLATRLFLLLVPAGLLFIALYPSGENYAFDFRVFWDAGAAFVDGTSPYPERTPEAISTKQNFLYPAPMAAIFAPISLIPFGIAAALFSVAVALAAIAALFVLGVRDWRCYGAVFLGLPLVLSVGLGTISTFLMLGLALLWRYRDRALVAAPVLALLVLSKLFLWPLVVWCVATRRFKTAAFAGVLGVTATLLAWWRVGLDTIASYPELLRLVAEVEQADSFSPTALAIALGVPGETAQLLATGLGLALLAAALLHRRTRHDEWTLLVAVLGVALVCSPIVWAHYLVLLFVPLAVARPQFSWVWLATFWMTPDNLQYGSELAGAVAIVLGLAAIAIVLSASLRGDRRQLVDVTSARMGGANQPFFRRTAEGRALS